MIKKDHKTFLFQINYNLFLFIKKSCKKYHSLHNNIRMQNIDHDKKCCIKSAYQNDFLIMIWHWRLE